MGQLTEQEAARIWAAVEEYAGAWKLAARTGNTSDFKEAVSADRGAVYAEIYQYVTPSHTTDSHGYTNPTREDITIYYGP